jgi:RNA polymerase primary sigma factor
VSYFRLPGEQTGLKPPTHPKTAEKRGYVTHDQINSVLSSERVKSEQIEDVLAMFSEMGINVVETEETNKEGEEPSEEGEEPREEGRARARSPSL